MSAPSSSGRWIHGVAKVLSTTSRILRARAISATAAMSTRRKSGLVGVSIQIMQLEENILSRDEYQLALHGKRHFRDTTR